MTSHIPGGGAGLASYLFISFWKHEVAPSTPGPGHRHERESGYQFDSPRLASVTDRADPASGLCLPFHPPHPHKVTETSGVVHRHAAGSSPHPLPQQLPLSLPVLWLWRDSAPRGGQERE